MSAKSNRGGRSRSPRTNPEETTYTPARLDVVLPMASGYEVRLKRPSFGLMEMLRERAMSLFPEPERPMEETEGEDGEIFRTPALEGTAAFDEWLQLVRVCEEKRAAHMQKYIFERRLEVVGYESEEQKKELIAKHQTDLEELREFVEVGEDADDFMLVLRNFVVHTFEDHQLIVFSSGLMVEMANFNMEEMLAVAKSFQRPLE